MSTRLRISVMISSFNTYDGSELVSFAVSLGCAGWPFFGQFVAHDITADRSTLRSHVDPSRLRNARSPQLNLECLYGDGPVGHPFLFRRDDPRYAEALGLIKL